MFFVFTGNWTDQEENKRVVIEAESQDDAHEAAKRFYPGFHQVQCFEVHAIILHVGVQ